MIPGSAPIGVFDSGLGGLSIAQEIHRLMPEEDIFYIGDTAHVPYGTRRPEEIERFSRAITRYLIEKAQCRVVVIACNTAVSAAAPALRETFSVPIVAIEPGVRPAVAQTITGKVGVLATQGTLTGDRFHSLVERFAGGVEVITQPCPGLVEQVERGDFDGPETRSLVERYVRPLLERGVDTLVLGCTHYPFLRPLIEQIAGPNVRIVDTGEAVARQTKRVLGVGRWALGVGCWALGVGRWALGDREETGGSEETTSGDSTPNAQRPTPNAQRPTPNAQRGIIEIRVTGEIADAEAGVRACFRAFGNDAPLITRLFWRKEELYDDATS